MRKTRTMDERLFDLAIDHWMDWVLVTIAPRQKGHRVQTGVGDAIGLWEAEVARARSNVEHADTVLASLLRDERRGFDWPASIHAMVLDMPRRFQTVLVGVALGLTQQEIGRRVGVSQQHVGAMMAVIKARLIPRLKMLASTWRVCERVLGCKLKPHLQHP